MKKFLSIIIVILLLSFSKGDALAKGPVYGSSAVLNSAVAIQEKEDKRVLILKAYLEEKKSPLAPYAQDFVENADKYNLDWKLVASIAGLESSFGLHQPLGSHNGWGWGYNNGTVKHFGTWEEAIEEISKGLRVNYLKDKPYSDPYIIGPTYAASPTWAIRVSFFMNQIENYNIQDSKSTLFLAL